MAMLPTMRCARDLTMGLGLAGALLVGPIAFDNPGASAATPFGIVALDDPVPPPAPSPAPDIQGPANQGNGQPVPPMRRRHIDSDPVIQR